MHIAPQFLSTSSTAVATVREIPRARLPRIKMVNPGTTNEFPDREIVARLQQASGYPTVNDAWYAYQGAAGAELWWRDWGWWVDQRRWMCYLEALNEVETKTPEQCIAVAAYLLRWLQILDERYQGAIHGVVGNWGQGQPEPEVMAYFLVLVCYMVAYGHLFGWHCYWWGRYGDADQARWHYQRWRYCYAELSRLMPGAELPRSMITELGQDGGVVNKPRKGWRSSGVSQEQYIADVCAFRDETAGITGLVTDGFYFCEGYAGTGSSDWIEFEGGSAICAGVAATNPEEAAMTDLPGSSKDNPIQEPLMPVDGRKLTIKEFREHVAGLKFFAPAPTMVVLHHTYRPTPETWQGSTTIYAMRRTYNGTGYEWQDNLGKWHRGWSAGPHLFIAPDGIWLFSPMTAPGIHASSWNDKSIGVEMVGDYDAQRPGGAILEQTVAVLAILLRRLGLGIDALKFHREEPYTFKSCPGNAVTHEWINPLVQAAYDQETAGGELISEAEMQAAYEALQEIITPYNPKAFLPAQAKLKGYTPASDEIRIGGKVYQAFRGADDGDKVQHIAWCFDGKYDKAYWYDKTNG